MSQSSNGASSTCVTTLLLGMLACRCLERGLVNDRNAKMGIAILIYAGYYLLYESARVWSRRSDSRPFPGLWIAPALLASC